MRLSAWFAVCAFFVPLLAQYAGTELDLLEHQTMAQLHDGRTAEAMNSALRAVALAGRTYPADNVNVTTSLNNLAILYQAQGEFDKAEPLLLRSYTIRKKAFGDEDSGTAEAANNLADLYRARGLPEKAEPLYLSALSVFERKAGPNDPATATVVNNLAAVYESQAKFSKSEAFFLRALKVRETASGPNSPDTAGALGNLAHLYEAESKYAQAEEYYTRAFDIFDRAYGGIHPDAALILNNQAQLYLGQRQFDKAEPILKRAITTFEKTKTNNSLGYAAALNNLGEIARERKQYSAAETLYRKAISVYSGAPDHPDTVVFFNNLGELYVSQGRYSDAEAADLKALEISERRIGKNHPTTGTILGNLAELYIAQHQYKKAEPSLRRALEIARATLGPDHPKNALLTDDLAILLASDGRAREAREVLASDWPHRISWADKSLRFGRESFRRGWISQMERQLSLLVDLQTDSPALRVLGLEFVLESKNRMSEELASAMASRYRIDSLKDVWEQQRRVELSDAANLIARSELRDQEDRLIAEISAHSDGFRELSSTPSIDEIRSHLANAVLVEFVRFGKQSVLPLLGSVSGPESYGAYLLDRDGAPRWVEVGPAETIDKLIQGYRQAMSAGPANRAAVKRLGSEIELAVFEPIRRAVPSATEFYIAPDGLLQLVPFNGLPDPDGMPLIQAFVLHSVSTGRDLVHREAHPPSQPSIVTGIERFGAPKPGRIVEFADLREAAREADEVAKIIPASQRVPADRLTRAFLLDHVQSPYVLHLATHGFGSGIALANANASDDGILTTNDVAMLRLEGTRLVVLSACQTAVGDTTFADGVVGLQRSLRLAGAQTEVLTLWTVSDQTTRDLMIAFYRNLFVGRQTRFDALRQAQIALANTGADPADWAPFVLYGDPGPLN